MEDCLENRMIRNEREGKQGYWKGKWFRLSQISRPNAGQVNLIFRHLTTLRLTHISRSSRDDSFRLLVTKNKYDTYFTIKTFISRCLNNKISWMVLRSFGSYAGASAYTNLNTWFDCVKGKNLRQTTEFSFRTLSSCLFLPYAGASAYTSPVISETNVQNGYYALSKIRRWIICCRLDVGVWSSGLR